MRVPLAFTDHSGAVRRLLARADEEGRVHRYAAKHDFALTKRTLDALESKGVAALRDALIECRDALIVRVKRADDLLKLATSLKRLPRFTGVRMEVRAMLDRAWEAGNLDARREVRVGKRSFTYDPNQPRDPAGTSTGGQWASGGAIMVEREARGLKRIAEGDIVDGLEVLNEIPNTASISASLVDYTSIGLREVPMAGFDLAPARTPRVLGLAEEIRVSGRISPLIVVYEKSGPYILEGAHRIDALAVLGKKSFPALVVLDVESLNSISNHARSFAGTESSFTPTSATSWMRANAFWISGIVNNRVLAEAQGILINGVKTGKARSVVAEELFALFVPYLGDPDVIADEEQLQPYRLETIVRTNTTTAYNHGRLTEFLDPETVRFLKGVRYSAVLDTRTTEVCRFLDGKVFKPSSSDLEALLPPNHYNCFISPRTKVMTFSGWRDIGRVRVGDLVLTHAGRFRAVTFVHHVQAPRTYQGDVVEVCFGGNKAVCTPEHPFLTERGWLAARDLIAGQDKVMALAHGCAAGCGAWIPEKAGNGSGKLYCSAACQLSHEYSTGKRDALKGLKAAHAKVRSLYAAGLGTLQKREVRAKAATGRACSELFRRAVTEGRRGDLNPMRRYPEKARRNGERLVKRWRENPDLHPNRKMVNVSKPQRRLFNAVSSLRDGAQLEHPIRIGNRFRFLDVALPEQKIALEYDGHHWHRDPERDARRAMEIENAGWSLLVYRGFVPSEQQLRDDLERVERNHSGEYRFASFMVDAVRVKQLRRSVRLYNLSVNEDESYIVGCGGAVVHNCRSIIVPIVAGEKIDESAFITPAQVGQARSLSDSKFLALARDVWAAYREEDGDDLFSYDPNQPRVPEGSVEGGQWTTTGVGRYFADAPLAGEGATAWRKKMQKEYDKNPEFRAVVDSIMLFTQGEYEHVRAMAQREITGQFADKWKDSNLPSWSEKPMFGNPLGEYREYFRGQPFLGRDSQSTWSDGARALNDAVRTSLPLSASIYRGVYGRGNVDQLLSMRPGQTFDVIGPTSFTSDQSIAARFSTNTASGQGGGGLARGVRSVVIEVVAGARGIPVQALSPWRQREVISSGRFQIREIRSAGNYDAHVVVEQIAVFRNREKK